ncbi:MAG: hypothetical protein JNL39_18665 [Opitutaceae bacterium]|nr:hypothetical protein [Opitutaceae bacterium]
MQTSAALLAACVALAGCSHALRQTIETSKPGEKSAFLTNVPRRIEDFKKSYARDHPLTSERFWLWDYAGFLGKLLREVNEKIGDGTTLAKDHLRAVSGFAEVQAISTRRYVFPMWRGASGYDAALAETIVALHEEILKTLIAAMGVG